MIDTVIRIHGHEFGSAPGGKMPRASAGPLDLYVTTGFPPFALYRARLGDLNIGDQDLWRLLEPDTPEGAIVIWPVSPAPEIEGGRYGQDDTADLGAARVISLIRVKYPDVRAARGQAILNVRSVAVAERDWQQHAPALVVWAPQFLRSEFDILLESRTGFNLRLPVHSDSAELRLDKKLSPSAVALLRKILWTQEMPSDLAAKCESEFWGLLAEVLTVLPKELLGRVSAASNLAPPFAIASVCYSSKSLAGLPSSVGQYFSFSPKNDLYLSQLQSQFDPQGLSQANHRECLWWVKYKPLFDTAELVIEELNSAAPTLVPLNSSDASNDPIGDVVQHLMSAASDSAQRLADTFSGELPSAISILRMIEHFLRIAQALPKKGGSTEAHREVLLERCEDFLIECMDSKRFLAPRDLREVLALPAVTALIRRILDSRPHFIAANIQVSLTLLANSGLGTAAILDECLRVLLPARWPSDEWLVLVNEEWAVKQALNILQCAKHERSEKEFKYLERSLVNRLSCVSLTSRRPQVVDNLHRTALSRSFASRTA